MGALMFSIFSENKCKSIILSSKKTIKHVQTLFLTILYSNKSKIQAKISLFSLYS